MQLHHSFDTRKDLPAPMPRVIILAWFRLETTIMFWRVRLRCFPLRRLLTVVNHLSWKHSSVLCLSFSSSRHLPVAYLIAHTMHVWFHNYQCLFVIASKYQALLFQLILISYHNHLVDNHLSQTSITLAKSPSHLVLSFFMFSSSLFQKITLNK